jgi:two-component system, OmpR family, sensor kinase
MKAFRSIRWRLQFWYALLLAFVLAGFGLAAYGIELNGLRRSTDAELERRVGALARAIRPHRPPPRPPGPELEYAPGEPPGPVGPGSAPEDPSPDGNSGEEGRPPREGLLAGGSTSREPLPFGEYGPGGPGNWYYAIWLHNGPALTRSWAAPDDIPRPAHAKPGIEGPTLRVRGNLHEAFLPLQPGDVVLVGHDMSADLQRLHRVGWLMAASATLILGLGLLGGHLLVGRSLKPIAEISAAATKIAAGNLNERIGTSDTDSELGQLAGVLNDTFARLEAAFARQTRFTADAAHELRTPLAVLLTHTQNALNVTCGSEEHREAFAACQRAAQRMRALTESLLWLARVDSGAQPPAKVRLDLADRVAACLELLKPLADRRGIVVKTDLKPVAMQGDPGQVDQVATNLIGNAIEHNVDCGEVRVSVFAGSGGGVLVVADNGPGIPDDHLPHVFERFYRSDQSRSRSSGGVGLGLAIAKAIVDAHGGTLEVGSRPGNGAVFTATFPLGLDPMGSGRQT